MFESGFYEIDSAWAFTSLDAAQRLLGLEDVVNTIELKLDDIDRAPEVASAGGPRGGPEAGRHDLDGAEPAHPRTR